MATVTLLQLKEDFWAHQNQLWQGTATGGSTTTLIDTSLSDLVSETYPTPVVTNRQLRITTGASNGDIRQIARIDEVRGVLYPAGGLGFSSTGPIAGDTYDIVGNGIHMGKPLTNLFNETMRRLRPLTQDQVTIVTNQRIYDISSLVADPDDVIEVWLRLIDPANLVPYTPVSVQWWRAFLLSGASIGGTSQIVLEIRPSLTNTTTTQMWVEHTARLPVFAADFDTIDAIYRDWLVWEAILTYAKRNLENVSTDHKVWEARKERALDELRTLRQRWIPLRPIRIRPEVPL